MSTMTDWFPCYVKPVRPGVYELRLTGDTMFSWFDGNIWCVAARTVLQAEKWKTYESVWQNKEWRGFTEEQTC
jgi:hypothetical protein